MSRFWHPPPRDFELGPVIGGRSGVTRVFAARDPQGTPCALKTLDPDAATRGAHAARFAREVEAHVAASGAPHVAPARVADDSGAWLAIAWAHGGDLAAAAERMTMDGGPACGVLRRPPRDIVVRLLGALAALHARGVAHRDLKPSNLLIDGDALWLTDFGVAARRETDGGRDVWVSLPPPWTERSVGTPPWSAPELLRELPAVTPASDVYAVAKVWAWMHELPSSRAHDAHTPHAEHERALLARMLDADPDARPTAAEALVALEPR